MANNISQLAWMADADGSRFWFNKRWLDYTGIALDEAKGWGWTKAHHPDNVQAFLERYRKAVKEGGFWEDTYPLMGKDGQDRWFLSRAMPIKDDHGRVVRWFGTNTDITEELNTQRNLERSNAELQQFAYVASHDLQEPLRTITAYLALLNMKYGDKLDDKAKIYMAYVVDGADRMKALINDLLEFSRVDTQSKEFSTVNMNLVAAEVLDTLHLAIYDNKATIALGPLPTVLGDRTQLSQVLQNLTGNAIKYHGPEAPRIEITSRQNSREWIISVRDNGIGIDLMDFDKLFQMFQRLHTRDEYPGTGIGLAIFEKDHRAARRSHLDGIRGREGDDLLLHNT